MVLCSPCSRGLFTILLLYFSFFAANYNSSLIAGTTGKISGSIHDISTGNPLIGANIIIVGTSLGAASDGKGQFVILNIPPGVYSVKGSMIGYTSVIYSEVRVSERHYIHLLDENYQSSVNGLDEILNRL